MSVYFYHSCVASEVSYVQRLVNQDGQTLQTQKKAKQRARELANIESNAKVSTIVGSGIAIICIYFLD